MSRPFTYLLAFDHTDPRVKNKIVHQYIKDSYHVGAWWHHLPGVYIFHSPQSADVLADVFKNILDQSKFIIVEINGFHSNGLLPDQAWAWLRNNSTQVKQISHGDLDDDIPF